MRKPCLDRDTDLIDPVELAELADRILAIAGENAKVLAEVLDTLDMEARSELLTSDLLNALQSFYYHFRELPTLLGQERLTLQPAAAAMDGILFEEEKGRDLIFRIEKSGPVIEITEGGELVVRFEGQSAYSGSRHYLME
ncbi:MAG: hypothetical protein ABSD81_00890 [Methanomicrobiales archaeon]